MRVSVLSYQKNNKVPKQEIIHLSLTFRRLKMYVFTLHVDKMEKYYYSQISYHVRRHLL